MNSDTLDLTRGSVPLCLIRFSFPLLLANLLQSFYSMRICWWWAASWVRPAWPL